MTIKIPVSADFNSDELNKQISVINARFKQMGEAVAKANGTKFEPITLRGKEDLKYFVQQSEKLLKIQGELNKRMHRSGQQGKNPFLANWSQMYTNDAIRLKRQQEALVFMGASFAPGDAPHTPNTPSQVPPVNRPRSGGQNPWVQHGTKIIQSGLNAAGPVGGVASNALGTGMSAGFGAGLAGLAGGLAALGVGKLVGAIADKISDAQTEAISSDQLMRRLGGGLGYISTRNGVRSAAGVLGLKYNDAMPLAESMARLGNLSGERAGQLPEELVNAGGFARGFGLDPSAGVGLFGQLRGMNLTKSVDDSRRVGVIIGETIAKSDAFGRADEVLQAIGDYATSQTRQSLGVLNMAGYAGQLSALASSGIPGLDVAGSAGLIGKVNSSLSQGGAAGEASQFFTAKVGNRMGLSPIQMKILEEGGAFATNDSAFGKGSVAEKFGIKGPKGNKTFLEETLAELRKSYSDPNMLAMATSRHLGIGLRESMALLDVKPNEMGDMQRRMERVGVDMKNVSSDSIADIAKINKPDADLKKIGEDFLARTGKGSLNGQEIDRLRNAMDSGDSEQLKDVLTKLAAEKGSAETEGSRTRDTIAEVSNRIQDFASKSLPLLSDSRDALLSISGKSASTVRQDAINSDHEDRLDAIKNQYTNLNAADQETEAAEIAALDPNDPAKRSKENQIKIRHNRIRRDLIIKRKAGEAEENEQFERAKKKEQQDTIDRYSNERRMGSSPINHDVVAQNESGNRDYDRAGNIITSSAGAMGRMQTMPGTLRDPGYGVVPARNNSAEEMARVGHDYLDAMYARYGNVDDALRAYNWGPGHVDQWIKEGRGKGYTDKNKKWHPFPAETREYVKKYHRENAQIPEKAAAQLPGDERHRSQSSNAGYGPLTGEVNVNLAMSRDLRRLFEPTPALKATVTAPKPYGT